jgi:hypothetical protein
MTSVAMSQIVKQTISVRTGNGVRDSLIFMVKRYVRPLQWCYFAFAGFFVTSHEVVCNPSFGIKAKQGVSLP